MNMLRYSSKILILPSLDPLAFFLQTLLSASPLNCIEVHRVLAKYPLFMLHQVLQQQRVFNLSMKNISLNTAGQNSENIPVWNHTLSGFFHSEETLVSGI